MLCQTNCLYFHGIEKFTWYPILNMEIVFVIWKCSRTAGYELNHWETYITCLWIYSTDEEINLFEEKLDFIKTIFLWVCTTFKKYTQSPVLLAALCWVILELGLKLTDTSEDWGLSFLAHAMIIYRWL